MKTQKIWFKNSKGQKLVGRLWAPNDYKHTLVFVNSFGTTKEEWTSPPPSWPDALAHKYRILIFDFRGRGESEGNYLETTLQTNIDDLVCAINYLKSNVTLIGGSFGGTTSIYVTSRYKKIECLVTMAAPHSFWVSKGIAFDDKKRIAIGKKPWELYNYYLFKNFTKDKMLRRASKIKVPWLIIHGSKDERVPVKHAKEYYAAAKCIKELQLVRSAGHSFATDEADEVLFLSLRGWLEKYLR